MHIYTMGTKQYAQKVAEIIDKDNTLFKEYRIVSRDDGPGGMYIYF
jgi:TFIIF-interacting CTD phosphatase-like protein